MQAFFVTLVLNPIPEGIENLQGYLYKAIINDIDDAHRQTRRQSHLLRTYAELSARTVDQKTPAELSIHSEEVKRILKIIQGRLPCSEAKAIALRYREGLSVSEAATKMGVNSMTLRGYACQGLCRVRRLLRNMESEVAV